MSIYQNNTSIFTPEVCELQNHGFVIFAMPHMLSSVKLPLNQGKATGYHHSINASIAFMSVSCLAGLNCISQGSQLCNIVDDFPLPAAYIGPSCIVKHNQYTESKKSFPSH